MVGLVVDSLVADRIIEPDVVLPKERFEALNIGPLLAPLLPERRAPSSSPDKRGALPGLRDELLERDFGLTLVAKVGHVGNVVHRGAMKLCRGTATLVRNLRMWRDKALACGALRVTHDSSSSSISSRILSAHLVVIVDDAALVKDLARMIPLPRGDI